MSELRGGLDGVGVGFSSLRSSGPGSGSGVPRGGGRGRGRSRIRNRGWSKAPPLRDSERLRIQRLWMSSNEVFELWMCKEYGIRRERAGLMSSEVWWRLINSGELLRNRGEERSLLYSTARELYDRRFGFCGNGKGKGKGKGRVKRGS